MTDKLPAFLALGCVDIISTPALAEAAADSAGEAPGQIVVTGEVPSPPDPASSKSVAPILDTPQTVTVISDQTLRKQTLIVRSHSSSVISKIVL